MINLIIINNKMIIFMIGKSNLFVIRNIHLF